MNSSDYFRHEYKYYINHNEYINLRNRLKAFLKHDSFADSQGNYHVRSLYFDDIHNSSLYEKNYGISERERYRIRIYNLADQPIKLERKERRGDFFRKRSRVLTRNEYQGITHNNMHTMQFNQNLLGEFCRKSLTGILRPKVIVDYLREAFVMDGTAVRITFDKHLTAGFDSTDIFNENLVALRALDKSLVIMEIKFRHFFPGHLSDLLRMPAHNRWAISKYVLCRTSNTKLY
ncbi:MAG: polyphosphate polymerase domain-containing protein [Chitinophagales bacterium]